MNPEQLILLDRKYKGFVRGGAALSDEEKEKFRAVTVEMSTLSLKFEENVLAETNDFDAASYIRGRACQGCPKVCARLRQPPARRRAREGWLFTLHCAQLCALHAVC
ncbi:MAG: hypothetical protein MZV63_20590 [Marinilabiliales bacterium]|nr:hypothetical protein [Marinilabiliales bacterium]